MALELPVLAGILKIIHSVGKDGVFTIVKWLMLFMCVCSSFRETMTNH